MKTLILLLIVISCSHSHKVPKVMDGTTIKKRTFYELGANKLLRNTSEATLAIWIKPSDLSDSNQHLVSLSVGGKHEAWKSRASMFFSTNGELISSARAEDHEERSHITTKPDVIKVGEWQHVVLTINYAAKKMQFFVNGEVVPLVAETYLFNTPQTSDTDSICSSLGAEDNGMGGFFNGELTQLRVERKILNDVEIKKLMKETRP